MKPTAFKYHKKHFRSGLVDEDQQKQSKDVCPSAGDTLLATVSTGCCDVLT